MTGLRIEEPKRGGGFALSLLAHGAVIAGIAAFAAPRPGLPQPEIQPIALVMVPAPVEAPTPPAPAMEPVQAAPAPTPAEPVAEAPTPPSLAALAPPVPEALPLPEPPPPVKAEPAKIDPKPVPKPAPRPAPKPAVAKAPAPIAPSPVAVSPLPAVPDTNAPAVASPPPATPVPEIAAGPPLITEPRFREPPAKPAYPPRAAALDQQGEALVRVLVTPEGEQEEVQLWRSSGFDLLDRAALAAVRRWRFEPYRRNGTAQAAWVQVPVRFTLN